MTRTLRPASSGEPGHDPAYGWSFLDRFQSSHRRDARLGVELGEDDRPDAVGGELVHAFEAAGAADVVAPRAPDAAPHRDARGPYGPFSVGARAGVDADHPRPGRRGQVERAGVVGEEDVGLAGERGELRQGRPAAEVEDRDRREPRDELLDERPVLGRADGEQPRPSGRDGPPRDLGEVGRAASASSPSAPPGSARAAAGRPRPGPLAPRRGRPSPTATRRPRPRDVGPERRGDRQQPVDRVRLVQRAGGTTRWV